MASVCLEHVSKQFPGGSRAVDDISLEIRDREFLVLVGPSGCGKSTTLRLIAGLETCGDGTIKIGERVVNQVAPKDRDVAMVFQNYALYPHMSVYNNLAFGLRLRYGGGFVARVLRRVFNPGFAAELNRHRRGIDQQVRQTASRLGISHLLDRKPHQLSGGERQRVALGRAIVRNPAAFLFDEPLSNLDAKLRGQMRIELKRLHRELGATIVYVTHDQVEAMTLGDRVAVMHQGRILQVGSPMSVYRNPANLYVAKFIGSVPINLLAGNLRQPVGKDRNRLVFESTEIRLEIDACAHRIPRGELPRRVVLGFRAEDVTMDVMAPGGERGAAENKAVPNQDGRLTGEVFAVDRLGDVCNVYVSRGGLPAAGGLGRASHVSGPHHDREEWDSTIGVYVVRTTAGRIEIGERVRLNLALDKVLWFDADTGENLGNEQA
jgi:multiple sugar transport system ATP-binding protein